MTLLAEQREYEQDQATVEKDPTGGRPHPYAKSGGPDRRPQAGGQPTAAVRSPAPGNPGPVTAGARVVPGSRAALKADKAFAGVFSFSKK